MPRKPRVIAVGCPHHVTQRGNNRRDVFLDDKMKHIYLELLANHARRFRLRILGYCLMTNHVHLIAVPETDQALAFTLRRAHGRFAQYWNTEMAAVGHLWQNRYYSCPVEPTRTFSALRYVELNPVRAAMTRRAEQYAWSSASAHISGADPLGLLDMNWWARQRASRNWRDELSVAMDANDLDSLRRATATGRPFGGPDYVSGLEVALGQSFEPPKRGRPRKNASRAASA